jgi:hypothetical protein
MRKSILLLSGLGIGAGVLYALTGRRDAHSNGASHGKDTGEEFKENISGNGKHDPAAEKRTFGNGGNGTKQASMSHLGDQGSVAPKREEIHEIDDQGTEPSEASRILQYIRNAAFESSNEKLALALGRPTEEIEGEINGSRRVDGDELMKARNLATARGVHIE